MNKTDNTEKLIFLSPAFEHKIWGCTKLRDDYGYEEPGDDIGECWGISAYPRNESSVKDGEYAGMPLSRLWSEHPEIFGREVSPEGGTEDDIFPLLVKIITAGDELSIQVHPDDEYASTHENGSLGKSECWYVLDAEPGSRMVVGHNALTRDELADMIDAGRWDELIRFVDVVPGDYLQIPPGTVHAIGRGVTLLETQQNSDITYRLYDYDRVFDGCRRTLHTKDSVEVISVPAPAVSEMIKHDSYADDVVCLVGCEHYEVYRIRCHDRLSLSFDRSFMLMSVTEGSGEIAVKNVPGSARSIKKGDHFIVPSGCLDLELKGDTVIIASCLPRI